MIVKVAPRPSKGSAPANVRYILGYQLGSKKGLKEQREGYRLLIEESLQRADLGVGSVWQPRGGDGKRPSSVFAKNVSSLATADVEMQAYFAAKPRVKSPTHHIIFGPDDGLDSSLSDEHIIEAAVNALGRIGTEVKTLDGRTIWLSFKDCPMVLAVHRDTEHVHVHCAVGTIDPETLLAVPTVQLNQRLHKATREVEIEFRRRGIELGNGRGLWVVRDPFDSRARVEKTTRAERHERSPLYTYGEYSGKETFGEYVDVRVIPRLREIVEAAADQGETLHWVDLHAQALAYDCSLEGVAAPEGPVLVLRSTTGSGGSNDSAQGLEALPLEAVIDPTLLNLKAAQYQPLEDAREAFEDAILSDPAYVLRKLSRSKSVFDSADVTAYIGARLGPQGAEWLHDIVVNDKEVEMLSPDAVHGVYTTRQARAQESRICDLSTYLASSRDELADRAAMDAAKRSLAQTNGFELSAEQSQLLDSIVRSRLTVGIGDPGVGKTTVMDAVRRYAQLTNRSIVGFTMSAAAAEKLEAEAGFSAINTTLAVVRDGMGVETIPEHAIVVLDEAGTISNDHMEQLLSLARRQRASVVAIGDPQQLPAVGAGCPLLILAQSAKDQNGYSEMHDVRRQKVPWHRDVVMAVAEGLRSENRGTIRDAVLTAASRGAIRPCVDADSAMSAAVEWFLDHREKGSTLLCVGSRDRAFDTNRAVRNALGLFKKGHKYRTKFGKRALVASDRIIFKRNSRDLGVLNGYTGTVLRADTEDITVQLDRGGIVTFRPASFKDWDWGYASTTYSSQGASVDYACAVLDSAYATETYHVAMSRSKLGVAAFFSEAEFDSTEDLADHISENTIQKATTFQFQKLIDETGGSETDWVKTNSRVSNLYSKLDFQEYIAEMSVVRKKRELLLLEATNAAQAEIDAAQGNAKRIRELSRRLQQEAERLTTLYAPISYEAWIIRRRRGEHKDFAASRMGLDLKSNLDSTVGFRSDVMRPPNNVSGDTYTTARPPHSVDAPDVVPDANEGKGSRSEPNPTPEVPTLDPAGPTAHDQTRDIRGVDHRATTFAERIRRAISLRKPAPSSSPPSEPPPEQPTDQPAVVGDLDPRGTEPKVRKPKQGGLNL